MGLSPQRSGPEGHADLRDRVRPGQSRPQWRAGDSSRELEGQVTLRAGAGAGVQGISPENQLMGEEPSGRLRHDGQSARSEVPGEYFLSATSFDSS